MNKAAHQRAKYGVRQTRKSRELRTRMIRFGVWIFIVVFILTVAGAAIVMTTLPHVGN
jgi:hypothetical protein